MANKLDKYIDINGVLYEIWPTAADLGLSTALKYCGKTTTALSDGSTTNPVVIDGTNHTAEVGCVVIDSNENKEYVWNGSKWELLGQDSSFALVGHTHPVETSTGNAAPHTHTHSVTVSGTTGNNSANTSVAKGTISSTGTGATVATGSSGTATVLTGVKVSSTATVVQDTSDYGVDATGTASVVTGVAANGTATAVTGLPNFSGGSGTTKYLHTGAESFIKTASYNSTTKILTITTGNALTSLTSNTTASDGIPYIATHTAASLGTLSTATVLTGVKASGTTTVITGTAGTSSSSRKTNVATAVAANGTATAVTGVSTSKLDLVNVAAHTHTHSFSATPTTGNNSGSAVKAITAVTVKASE